MDVVVAAVDAVVDAVVTKRLNGMGTIGHNTGYGTDRCSTLQGSCY